MKEYIPLEWFEEFLVGENLSWDGRNIPTVAKMEICMECYDIFTKKANEMWNEEDARNFHSDLANILDALFAEMESEE